MKAIAINGSPRKHGNTEILLRAVLKPLTDAGWSTNMADLGQTIAWLGKALHQSPEKISAPVYTEPAP